MMNNIFSLNRFWLLVRKHANENRKLLLISFAVMIIPAIFIELMYSRYNPHTIFGYYIFFLLLIGTVYTSLFFKNWDNISRATSMLTLPSTAFEKIALVQFYTVVLFIPVFTIIFLGTNLTLYELSNPGMPFLINELIEKQSLPFAFCTGIILPYILIQSFILLISVWIRKSQYVIGLVILLILLITNSIWITSYMKGLTDGVTTVLGSTFMLFPTSVKYLKGGHSQEITSQLISNISTLVYLLMTLLFYIASCFKLKEKEI